VLAQISPTHKFDLRVVSVRAQHGIRNSLSISRQKEGSMQDEAEPKAINQTNRCRACVPGASQADIAILTNWKERMRRERRLADLTLDAYGTDARQFADFMGTGT